MSHDRGRQAFVIEAGYVPPFFYQVDQQEQGCDPKQDPPEDVRDELLEQFPAGEIGIAYDLACGGPVEPVILFRSSKLARLLRACLNLYRLGSEVAIGAEEEIKTFHSNRGIGRLAFLDVDVDLFRRHHLAADHPGEVEAEIAGFAPGPVGGQEDVISLPGERGLDIIPRRVERIDGNRLPEDRQRGFLRFVRFGCDCGLVGGQASFEGEVKEDVAGANLVVDPCGYYVSFFFEDPRGDLDRVVPIFGFMVYVFLVNLLAVDPDGG